MVRSGLAAAAVSASETSAPGRNFTRRRLGPDCSPGVAAAGDPIATTRAARARTGTRRFIEISFSGGSRTDPVRCPASAYRRLARTGRSLVRGVPGANPSRVGRVERGGMLRHLAAAVQRRRALRKRRPTPFPDPHVAWIRRATRGEIHYSLDHVLDRAVAELPGSEP